MSIISKKGDKIVTHKSGSLSRVPATVLFSILLLMSFGLTQNVSADEVETAPSVCLNAVDQVDFTIFDLHSIAVIPLSETEVRILAQGGGLSPGSPGIPPDPRDQAIFIIDGGGIGNVDFSSLSDIGTSFGVTFTGLSPGTHTVVVCYIDRTNIGFISFTLVETLTHTDVFTFTTGPVVDLCAGVDCSNLDDQCSQGTCDPSDGSCFPTPVNNLGICDDGDACTTGDFCLVARCMGGSPTDCSALDDQCNAAMCDSVTGCFSEPVADGTQCDDEDPNTQNDMCTAGLCSGVTPGGFSCGLGTTPNLITNECDPDVTQAQLDQALAAVLNALDQRDAILTTLTEFLRVFGVI